MSAASLIKWIDREYDEYPGKATSSLCLLLIAVVLPLMIIGWNAVTVSLAFIWSVPWTALYLWRGAAWVGRLEANRKRRERRKRRRD